MRLSSVLVFTFGLLCAHVPVLADTVYFRDGREANGKIVAQSDTQLTIQTTTGKWTYNRVDIIRIDYAAASTPPAARAQPVEATDASTPIAARVTPTSTATGPLGVELGGGLGLLWFDGTTSLKCFGGGATIDLEAGSALRLAYFHAGVSLYGLEVLGMNFLEATLLFDLTADKTAGVYLTGGGGYVSANLLGEGELSRGYFLVGAGLRIGVADVLTIRVGYLGRLMESLMHGVTAELSLEI